MSTSTIPSQFFQLESTGRLDNLRKAARGESGFVGYRFNDSDVYKWIEACAFSLMNRPSADNRALMDKAVEIVRAAQMEDGYLNSYFQTDHPDMRWRNISMMHEMYCGGHLIEAAVAHYEATGTRDLLDVAVKWTEHVMSIFGPDKRIGACGHEEMELALLKLADATGDTRYPEFAKWQIEIRGHRPSFFAAEFEDQISHDLSPLGMALLKKAAQYSGEYLQDHAPIREHDAVVGHAVRAMYLYIAASQISENDPALEAAIVQCWHSLVDRRMYVTGGIGPSGDNEGFTQDFDLPNHSAYAETCAAIGLTLWGHRLFERTGDSSYVDTMERALYNGVLSGIATSGDRYFYANPLESRGDHERVEWFGCACCPSNVARLIGQVGQLAISEGEDGIWLNLPIGLDVHLTRCRLTVESDYPWSGSVKVTIFEPSIEAFALRVRIPDWCEDCAIECDSMEEPAEFEDGYAVIKRIWSEGDVVTFDFEMNPTWIESHPSVLDNLGRVALTHGPLVYCFESCEGPLPQRFRADLDFENTVRFEGDSVEGANVISAGGYLDLPEFVEGLYAEAGTTRLTPANVEFIPYFRWNNHGKAYMQVWVRTA